MARLLNKLTDLAVRKSSEPGYLGDGGGLYLQVAAAASGKPSKSWVYRYQIHGKAREMGLGAYPTFTLEDARNRASAARKLVADKKDPIELRNAERREEQVARVKAMTFGQCCAKYVAAHSAKWKNAKHRNQWASTLQTYCEPIWKLDVAAIDTDLVMRCLEPIWHEKTETANRLRGRMESVLAWATVRKLRTGDNPAAWKKHLDQLLPARSELQKVEHRPALPHSRIAEYMGALHLHVGLGARALELQILTATRPGEATGARWEEFNMSDASWTIPAERMKAGKEHRIPLSTAALKLLKGIPHITPHVFPGRPGKSITTAAGEKVVKTLHAERVEMDGVGFVDSETKLPVVPHGFRSTFRDWAAETANHPREVIEAAMAHRLKDKSEAAYQRSDLLQRRAKLMADWSKFLSATQLRPSGKSKAAKPHRT